MDLENTFWIISKKRQVSATVFHKELANIRLEGIGFGNVPLDVEL